jgi:hypothetical protein
MQLMEIMRENSTITSVGTNTAKAVISMRMDETNRCIITENNR